MAAPLPLETFQFMFDENTKFSNSFTREQFIVLPYGTKKRVLMQRVHNVLVDIVIGGYALFFHNYERLTTDIDLLVSSDDFSQICSLDTKEMPMNTDKRHRRRDRQHRSSSKRSRSRD
ncbi:unnamed protein product, partial [Didymodactylos carnosus]